jgi:hypothetical protein
VTFNIPRLGKYGLAPENPKQSHNIENIRRLIQEPDYEGCT